MKPYTVRRLTPQMVIPLVGMAVVLLIAGRNLAGVIVAVVWLVLVAFYLRRVTLVLRVDERGVRLQSGQLPWEAIREVDLEGEQLRLHLTDGTVRSAGIQGLDRDRLQHAVRVPLRSY